LTDLSPPAYATAAWQNSWMHKAKIQPIQTTNDKPIFFAFICSI